MMAMIFLTLIIKPDKNKDYIKQQGILVFSQNDNRPCSARFLANKLNVDADYLANSVLPRMYVIGLLKKQVLSNDFQTHLTDEDRKIPDILGFNLNLNWEGKVHGRWL